MSGPSVAAPDCRCGASLRSRSGPRPFERCPRRAGPCRGPPPPWQAPQVLRSNVTRTNRLRSSLTSSGSVPLKRRMTCRIVSQPGPRRSIRPPTTMAFAIIFVARPRSTALARLIRTPVRRVLHEQPQRVRLCLRIAAEYHQPLQRQPRDTIQLVDDAAVPQIVLASRLGRIVRIEPCARTNAPTGRKPMPSTVADGMICFSVSASPKVFSSLQLRGRPRPRAPPAPDPEPARRRTARIRTDAGTRRSSSPTRPRPGTYRTPRSRACRNRSPETSPTAPERLPGSPHRQRRAAIIDAADDKPPIPARERADRPGVLPAGDTPLHVRPFHDDWRPHPARPTRLSDHAAPSWAHSPRFSRSTVTRPRPIRAQTQPAASSLRTASSPCVCAIFPSAGSLPHLCLPRIGPSAPLAARILNSTS